MSVTDPRQKAPILRQAAAMELREDEGKPREAEGRERAVAVVHRPARGPEEQVSGGIRRAGYGGGQRLLVPASTVMLGSPDRWPLAELVRRPRGQQGPEHAFQGPWTDLVLQHPTWGPRARHGCCRTRCCRPRRGGLGGDR